MESSKGFFRGSYNLCIMALWMGNFHSSYDPYNWSYNPT